MATTILIDQDLKGHGVFIEVGLRETGWDQLLELEFKRLSDLGLPDNYPDNEIWRFVQQHHLLLITNNRNNDGETSLQATIERENSLDALPVITVSDREALLFDDYRQPAAHSLAAIVLYPDDYRGTGRIFVPFAN